MSLLSNALVFVLCLGLVRGEDEQQEEQKFTRYAFWRSIDNDVSEPRRVFGDTPAELTDFPAVASLLDRYYNIRCSGSVITEHWVITAAHCVTSRLSYISYNTKRPFDNKANVTAVMYLYRHPNYRVVQEDAGRGMDVTLLHHDLGLIRTRDVMILNNAEKVNKFLEFATIYAPKDLMGKDVTIMGFGNNTEESSNSVAGGEELFSATLLTVKCGRKDWIHSMCGIGTNVCSGDSGGPVVYRKVQVGVASMGPVVCAIPRVKLKEGSTSVFTLVHPYVPLIKATIRETEAALKKKGIKRDQSEKPLSKSAFCKPSILIFVTIIAIF